MNGLFSPSHRSARRVLFRIDRQLQIDHDRVAARDGQRIRCVCETLRQHLRGHRSVEDRETLERLLHDCREAVTDAGMRFQEGGMRGSVEFLLVAVVLALTIRTFFYEPISIPTDSAAPTFEGVRIHTLKNVNRNQIPGLWKQWYRRVCFGERYCVILAERKGELRILDEQPTTTFLGFRKQRFELGGLVHTVWNPPPDLWARNGLTAGMGFESGDPVVALIIQSGDRILVNRWITQFRQARRGESVVFEATGLEGRARTEKYFIKRLIGLSGETVSIGDDRHVRINGSRLDRSDAGFAQVYGFSGPPEAGRYSGHVNGATGRTYSPLGERLAPHFPTEDAELRIPEDSVWVLGDNTLQSLDGRHWGAIPESRIVGIAGLRFWPFLR